MFEGDFFYHFTSKSIKYNILITWFSGRIFWNSCGNVFYFIKKKCSNQYVSLILMLIEN